MILSRDLLTALGLGLNFSKQIIIESAGLYEGWSAPMIDVINYGFKPLTENILKPEEPFINAYFGKWLKSEGTMSSTFIMGRILYTKYKEYELNKVMAK